MKTMKINLSIYSYAYGFGFLDKLNSGVKYDLDYVLQKIKDKGLDGIELPFDIFFLNAEENNLVNFLARCKKMQISISYALENFSADYLKNFLRTVSSFKNRKIIRVKISNFYGGNRFINKQYKNDIKKFKTEFNLVKKYLDKYDYKILIENHQDLDCSDLDDLISYGDGRIGINWDIGNSLPTGLTPDRFYKRYKDFIGNVHLKDYKLKKTDNGYSLHRCILGNGIIDFKEVFSTARRDKLDADFTIELGAHRPGEALINNDSYWTETKGISKAERNELLVFINSKASSQINNSLLEQDLNNKQIIDSESNEVDRSIENILKAYDN